MRILVVEDNEAVAVLLRTLLTRHGHQVDVCIDPSHCPYHDGEIVACSSPGTPCADAIIVDYQMRNMTGLELLLQQQQNGCRVPNRNKAVASALINNERRIAIERHGFTVLRKPFEKQRLNDFLAGCVLSPANDD